MGRQPSWRAVAVVLANRLSSHAFCEQHDPPGSGEGCPFCDDVRAIDLWRAKRDSSRALPAPVAGDHTNESEGK